MCGCLRATSQCKQPTHKGLCYIDIVSFPVDRIEAIMECSVCLHAAPNVSTSTTDTIIAKTTAMLVTQMATGTPTATEIMRRIMRGMAICFDANQRNRGESNPHDIQTVEAESGDSNGMISLERLMGSEN